MSTHIVNFNNDPPATWCALPLTNGHANEDPDASDCATCRGNYWISYAVGSYARHGMQVPPAATDKIWNRVHFKAILEILRDRLGVTDDEVNEFVARLARETGEALDVELPEARKRAQAEQQRRRLLRPGGPLPPQQGPPV